MERQFTFVKRFAMQDHPFRDFAQLNDASFDISDVSLPTLPIRKPPIIKSESFLTLYCLQDDR